MKNPRPRRSCFVSELSNSLEYEQTTGDPQKTMQKQEMTVDIKGCCKFDEHAFV